MTEVTVFESESGQPVGLSARGHAGDAPRGESVVCASFSTIFEMLISGGSQLPEQAVEYERDPQVPAWRLVVEPDRLERKTWDKFRPILDAATDVTDKIAAAHPEHCTIEVVEITSG